MPKISIIVPIFQAEKLLKKCIYSVINQTFSDWELILINDGSTDNSLSICNEFSKNDERIIVIDQKNSGVSVARNTGLKKALGQYIAFLDSDDWFEPNALQLLIESLENNNSDTSGCAHFNVFSNGEKTIEKSAMPFGVYNSEQIHTGIINRLVSERLGHPSNLLNGFIWRFLFSREIIVNNNIYFNGAYLEDELFLINYFCFSSKLTIIEEPLYYYLENHESATRKYMPNFENTFTRFFTLKKELVSKFSLQSQNPNWEDNTNWAGILIAVGNEYAKGNNISLMKKQQNIINFTKIPSMKMAIKNLKPKGLARNKQLVVNLIQKKMFFPLSILYLIKNR